MLSLPEKYCKNAPITKITFVRGAGLLGAEKKRFETAVENIQLKYQIEGFDIPNIVDEEYNCQVIMFISVKIKDLKQAAFISKIIQKCISALCVIEFTDGTNVQYSFADKRLNKQNNKTVVIENEYLTEKMTLNFQNDLKTLFYLYIDYETILNRNNKHTYYIEMMTKAFLVCERGIFAGADIMLDNKKLWYDNDKASKCFYLLKQLKILKSTASKTKTLAEKSIINKQIKTIISDLEVLNER